MTSSDILELGLVKDHTH